MLRTIFWALWLFGYFIIRLPSYFKVKRLAKQGKKQEHDALVRQKVSRWAAVLLRHIRMQVAVEGRENLPKAGEVVVFAANHQSYMDIPILLANLDFPHPLMAKKELGKIPFLSGWMNELGCVYVDRDDARASVSALKKAEKTLKEGSSFIVYPEGTRAKSDTMGEFKAGAVRMAYKTGVPVVPVAIDGSYKALEGNRWRLQKSSVRLVILPPVPTQGLSREEQKQLPARLQQIVQEAKEERDPRALT